MKLITHIFKGGAWRRKVAHGCILAGLLGLSLPEGRAATPLTPGSTTALSNSLSFPLQITQDGTYRIKGSFDGTPASMVNAGTQHGIEVARGLKKVTVILENAGLQTSALEACAFLINGNPNADKNTVDVSDTRPWSSVVTVKLEGENYLYSCRGVRNSSNHVDGLRAGLEIWKGSTVYIEGTGKLTARSSDSRDYYGNTNLAHTKGPYDTVKDPFMNYGPKPGPSVGVEELPGNGGAAGIGGGNYGGSGGNVVIRSGTVIGIAGSHGAGIGGGWANSNASQAYFSILIYGGHVESWGGDHGAGIGGGCGASGQVGTIVVLPPAEITAASYNPTGAQLGAMKTVVYVGDPTTSRFTIYTEPDASTGKRRNTHMYLDLHDNAAVDAAVTSLAPQLDSRRLFLGTTTVYPDGALFPENLSESGQPILQQYATLSFPVTFFTDAKNDRGFEYVAKTATIVPQLRVELHAPTFIPVVEIKEYGPSAPGDTSALNLGYTAAEAITKAVTLIFKNEGNQKLYSPSVQLTADDYTAVSGGSLDTAIQTALNGALQNDTVGAYLPAGASFSVKAVLVQGRPEGSYTGYLRFHAKNVPPEDIKSVPFVTRVVELRMPPPKLIPSVSETNASSFSVEMKFDRPVSGLTNADIQVLAGTGTVSGMAPSGTAPSDTWTFTLTPAAPPLTNGRHIQMYAKAAIASDRNGAKTSAPSATVDVRFNVNTPYPVFRFLYDLPTDSVFLSSQTEFTFTLMTNGSTGNGIADEIYDTGGLASGNIINNTTIGNLIEVLKNASPLPATAWKATVESGNLVRVTAQSPFQFDDGDYVVRLKPGVIQNNLSNLMDEKFGGFRVRIPRLLPGGGCSSPDEHIGYGIAPAPTALDFRGGSVRLVIVGEQLHYAAKAQALEIRLPASLGGRSVVPQVAAAGDSAFHTLTLPWNSKAVETVYDFEVRLFGVRAPGGSGCSKAPVGKVTQSAAPSIHVAPPVCSDCSSGASADEWFDPCEKTFTVTVPETGSDREVTITYLGLAENYLVAKDGGQWKKLMLPKGITEFTLAYRTLRVPDELEGGSGAIVVSTPALPGDTSVRFRFWNSPDLSDMVYMPRTTQYEGRLELHIRGGSPGLLRSFDHGRSWENARLPVTPFRIANLEDVILFREPGGCDEVEVPIPVNGTGGMTLERKVLIPRCDHLTTSPPPGEHFVKSGKDFVFTLTLSGPYAGGIPEVSTGRQLSPDEVYITPLGRDAYRVRIPALREDIRVIFRVNGSEIYPTGSEPVESTRIGTGEGCVYITAAAADNAEIYTLTGALLKRIPVFAGKTVRTPLSAGFYLVILGGETRKIAVH
ncbi:MAG: hypothetical protein LBP50_00770 [Tannerella sp.]|nr:hypothetical protein [Tannerella sp.]